MKKTIAFLFMSAFLFMGQGGFFGCSTGIKISGPAVIAAVQGLCGIVIPIADIAALVAANPDLTNADLVANTICNSFKAQMAAAGGRTAAPSGQLIVDGVLVHWTVKT
jgi:hypothetical protein